MNNLSGMFDAVNRQVADVATQVGSTPASFSPGVFNLVRGISGAKPKTSRIPVFPAEWQNQFGLPYNEHKQSLQVDILNGYAVYSIKDTAQTADNTDPSEKQIPADILEQLDVQ